MTLSIANFEEEEEINEKPKEGFFRGASRGFIEGATPTLSTPGSKLQRQKEAEATSEELIDVVEGSDVFPGYTSIPMETELEDFITSLLGKKGINPESTQGQRIGDRIGSLLRFGGLTPQSMLAAIVGAIMGEQTEKATGSPLLGFIAEVLGGGAVGGAGGAKKEVPKKALSTFAEEEFKMSPKVAHGLTADSKLQNLVQKAGRKGKPIAKFINEVNENVDTAFNILDSVSEAKNVIKTKPVNKFIKSLSDLNKQIRTNINLGPSEKEAIEEISTVIQKMRTGNVTNQEAINYYRTLNDKINWNNLNRGNQFKSKIRLGIKDMINESEPELGKKFTNLDKLYSKKIDLLNSLTPSEIQQAGQTLNDLRSGGKVLEGLFTNDIKPLREVLGVEAARRLLTAQITNPKVYQLTQKIFKSASEGSKESIRRLIPVLNKELQKTDPEIDLLEIVEFF